VVCRESGKVHEAMRHKVVGILGGMGPESTVDLFSRIVKATPAQKDQDHLRIIIDNNPKIPDRTQAILGKAESPLEELRKTARNLEKAGAEIIAIPCNTAYYYYEDLQKSINIPIINMILETAKYIYKELPTVRKIGLLSTVGTIKTKLYQNVLKEIEIVVPDVRSQQRLMNAIYGKRGIKCGYTQGSPRRNILEVARSLVKQGVEAIIMGCTETSLVLRQQDLPVPLIDPLQVLAEVTTRQARLKQ
jgi:aspartate racemase